MPGMDPSAAMLTGKVAIVTGGGAGIGRGIADGFVAFGARLVVFERDEERGAATAEELGARGVDVLAIPVDVRDGAGVEQAVARTLEVSGAPALRPRRRILRFSMVSGLALTWSPMRESCPSRPTVTVCARTKPSATAPPPMPSRMRLS